MHPCFLYLSFSQQIPHPHFHTLHTHLSHPPTHSHTCCLLSLSSLFASVITLMLKRWLCGRNSTLTVTQHVRGYAKTKSQKQRKRCNLKINLKKPRQNWNWHYPHCIKKKKKKHVWIMSILYKSFNFPVNVPQKVKSINYILVLYKR